MVLEQAQDTVHRHFEKIVECYSTQSAIVYGNISFNYRELNDAANSLAYKLLACGVVPGSIVGVYLERSPQLVIAVLAILKAGGAYLPLDVHYPYERIEYMLSNAQAHMVITLNKDKEKLTNIRTLVFDDHINCEKNTTNPSIATTASDLIYINYTSGSTGQPKGVAITHRSVMHLLSNPQFVKLDDSTVILQIAPAVFDAFTFELWGALLHGGTCLLHQEKLPTVNGLRQAIKHYHVTTMFITTALFNLVVDEDVSVFSGLSQLLMGGEKQSIKHIQKAYTHLSNVQLIHCYGPTECTTFTTTHLISEEDFNATTIPIGRPLHEAVAWVLDDNLKPLPVNTVGHLYIGGPGLAREYIQAPMLTAEKFIYTEQGVRLYKTGDLARILPNGCIDYVDRVDTQVKIHGFRIELGEIESVLMEHDSINQAVVLVEELTSGSKKLVAYLLAKNQAIDSNIMSTYLAKKLPRYMIPYKYHWLTSFPLTTNGKVDKKKIVSMAGAVL